MSKSMKAVFTASMVALAAACSDGALEPVASGARPVMELAAADALDMSNYVAIGTSLSMGWASDGVHKGSQATSWTAQLAQKMGAPWSFPAISLPGCKPPYMAPLASFRRIDGSSIAESSVCAPNEPGVTLPTNNLAVEFATANEALTGAESPFNGRAAVTSRVLPAGMTQVSAMESMNPSFVTIEIGGNEILSAQVGRLVAGETFTPYEDFRKSYRDIVHAVKKTGAQALLVSIGADIRKFPAIRTGPEIASQRLAFAQFNVRVSEDCDASENYLFVRGIIPTALQSGAAYARMGLGQYTLSCADRPDQNDYILTPADVDFINDLAAQMSAEIERQAHSRGYATFPLGALYNTAKDGVPFNLFAYLTSPTPYGPLISLDGVHPSPAGAAVLAGAAAKAIEATYGVAAMAGQN